MVMPNDARLGRQLVAARQQGDIHIAVGHPHRAFLALAVDLISKTSA